MTLLTFAQYVLTLLYAGKFLVAAKFISSRIASWIGIGLFWKKGKSSGKKRFYVFAFLIWLISWGVFLFFSYKLFTKR